MEKRAALRGKMNPYAGPATVRGDLGVHAPWFVDRVELELADGEVHVHLEHHEVAQWPCPECGEACRQYDHQPERRWRHLDTCKYQTILHAKPPRAECERHGVRVVKLPWAEPSSRFTALFERLAIDWLTAASQKAVGERNAAECCTWPRTARRPVWTGSGRR